MLKFIAKNSILYTFANQIPMFANLLLYPLISEFLTAYDYYVFGTAMGYMGLFGMIADLGMSPLFQNAFFKKEKHYRKFWARYLGFLLLYKMFYGLVAGTMIWLVFRNDLPSDRLWLLISLLVIPLVTFDLTRGVGMRLMQFKHKHKVVHLSTAIAGILTVVTTFITIYIMKLGYLGFFISNFVSVIFQGIFFAFVIYGKERILPSFKLKRRQIKGWLKISLPLIPHKFSDYLLTSSDRIILDQYVGVSNVSTTTVGMYNVAYNFASYFNSFSAQVNTVVSPIYFSLFRDKNPRVHLIIRQFTFIWLAFNYLAATLAGLWSKEVFSFFFMNNKDGLETAYKYTIFLFMAFCYRPLYVASVEFIIYQEKTMSLFKITTAAGILNVALNLALVPFWGVEAAIFSTFICYMYMGVSGHLFKDTKQYLPLPYYPLTVFAIVTITGFLVYYAVELHWLIKAVITLITLLLAFIFYLKKGKSVIKEVQQIRVK
ncbi:MAG: O-antigen/teichoic acid export membrane protein [Yoonia sp.]|jgi:O-antigen/teichoic acid export membrane protein